ncbi:hypothetical protein VR7878_03103 [Vibrio ruber DSM 16370]|uniref:Uncharacterized protein n=1 Tax=Vibrio ruber (strain DSM 16370 / JCM 11486 / BCRC 17186 / CECT 7878 / LMG 23124 / VR1) TaxID=1123498 RepID=A0A1R4LRF1_VIBR1|nr:hypothetical protein [Vibrio ruber]SJN58894.1 hypothetical protein VR7878_03103 [Vibrio ruber DSM 16370]
MKFTTNEIAAMRRELMNHAFSALVRRMPLSTHDAHDFIARHLGISLSTVLNMSHKEITAEYAGRLNEVAQCFGIRMFRYQFIPTDNICRSWLAHAYQNDKGRQPHKHIFEHWERDMTKVKVREAA